MQRLLQLVHLGCRKPVGQILELCGRPVFLGALIHPRVEEGVVDTHSRRKVDRRSVLTFVIREFVVRLTHGKLNPDNALGLPREQSAALDLVDLPAKEHAVGGAKFACSFFGDLPGRTAHHVQEYLSFRGTRLDLCCAEQNGLLHFGGRPPLGRKQLALPGFNSRGRGDRFGLHLGILLTRWRVATLEQSASKVRVDLGRGSGVSRGISAHTGGLLPVVQVRIEFLSRVVRDGVLLTHHHRCVRRIVGWIVIHICKVGRVRNRQRSARRLCCGRKHSGHLPAHDLGCNVYLSRSVWEQLRSSLFVNVV